MIKRKIGAFICGCGGNISDYVDVEKVRDEIEKEPGVEIARTAMFTCSDATQREIIDIIKEKELDGIIVASCSPKLHLHTFRAMAKRAGSDIQILSMALESYKEDIGADPTPSPWATS